MSALRSTLGKDGYRGGVLAGTALGFFLAQLPVPIFGAVVLVPAGCYFTYQVVRLAVER